MEGAQGGPTIACGRGQRAVSPAAQDAAERGDPRQGASRRVLGGEGIFRKSAGLFCDGHFVSADEQDRRQTPRSVMSARTWRAPADAQ